MAWHERLDRFPTQLVLTILWATFGTGLSLIYRSSILWVSLMSVYAIVISHFTAHLSWSAKQAAKRAEDAVASELGDDSDLAGAELTRKS